MRPGRWLCGIALIIYFIAAGPTRTHVGAREQPVPWPPYEPTRVDARHGLTPQEAARAMTAPEGFHVTLIAAEPDVRQPVAITMDHRGRLWIAEAYSYPQRRSDADAQDRIVIFEDANGDGTFETRKIFTDKLNLVSGLEVGFGGVWVGAAPYLLFIPDRDGNDVPDGPAEVLLDGWGYHDTHETLNSFVWGPDGWLYGNHGVFNESSVGKPGTPADERIKIAPGVWRYHPTRHVFEVFAHGGSNQWGLDFDDRGQAFMTTCRSQRGGGPVTHVVQGGHYWRQSGTGDYPHVYEPMKASAMHDHGAGGAGEPGSDAKYGGHAHVGTMIYLGDSWPESYRNTLFTHNLHGGRINHEINERRGSGFLTTHARGDFLFANDPWFVGVDLIGGPDGSMFMIDWYDRQHCYHRQIDKWDRSNGRIYKVAYGQPAPLAIDLGRLGDRALAELQLHRNDWFVRMARRLLQERAAVRKIAPDATRALERQLHHPDARRRLRALWALHVTGGLTEKLTNEVLASDDEYVRGWGIQLAGETPARSQAGRRLGRQWAAMARKDPSAVVRLYLSSAARRLPLERRSAIVEALAAHPEDASDRNLPAMIWFAAEPLVARDLDRGLALAKAARIPTLARFIYRRVALEPRGLDKVVALLAEGRSRGDDERGLILDGMIKALEGRGPLPAPASWDAVSPPLYASANPIVRRSAEILGAQFGNASVLATLRARLADRGADASLRRQAMGALLARQDTAALPVYEQLLDEDAFRTEAIRALARFDDPRVPAALVGRYAGLTPTERAAVVTTLAGRPASALVLLDAVKAGRVPRRDISPFAARQMTKLDSAGVTARLNELWGQSRSHSEEKAGVIKKLRQSYTKFPAWSYGPDHGRVVFNRLCAPCHKLFGEGGQIGPDLTESNRNDLDYLLENVVDPSALIGQDFQLSTVKTRDGRFLTGMINGKTDAVLTVQTANELLSLPRRDVQSIETANASMMPEGLLESLNEEELRNLLAYLMGQRQVALPDTPSKPETAAAPAR